ncbi:MAG TPA: hypothetical protein VGI40_24695 [Pirellulaceae bacterium]|jgi:hypothetical protein
MRKLLVAFVVAVLGGAVLTFTTDAQETAAIKEVMKVAMKGGLAKKVASGEATDEEKKKLAGLFSALHDNKPPKGEQSSWDAKTKALVDAANEVLAGKASGNEKLKELTAAGNCMACHSAHKGK